MREIYAAGDVLPTWISGTGNGSDIYTKAVGRQLFESLALGETGYSDGPLPRVVITLTPTEARNLEPKFEHHQRLCFLSEMRSTFVHNVAREGVN